MTEWVSKCGRMTLRLGKWQDVLQDVQADHCITDPPYSERVEKGVRSGSTMQDQRNQIGMGYSPVDMITCLQLTESWTYRCGWLLICCDHISWQWHEAAARKCGRYVFHPIPIVKSGAVPRMCADGPASQSEYIAVSASESVVEYIAVSRPSTKEYVGTWGGIPGWYPMATVRHGHGHHGVRGAKSLDLMRALVRDYSRTDDLIVDPFCGSGTTLLAAVLENRRAIGSEMCEATYHKAVARLSKGYTPNMQVGRAEKPKQGNLC